MIGEGIIVISKKLENGKQGRTDIHTYPLSRTPSPLRLASSPARASLQASLISSIRRLISSIFSFVI